MRGPALILVTAVAAALGFGGVGAQEGAVRARYTKHDYDVPMRDGTRLFTSVYVPKDTTTRYPILLQRTPYSVAPYGIDAYREALGPSPLFERDAFIFVYQDVRGRYLSGGEWVEMRPHRPDRQTPGALDESTDTYDTIAWLLEHLPNHNGRVGMWGISYPGFYVAAALPGAHPALVAASPQAPIADLYMGDDAFHNGAFMLAANFGFYAGFRPRDGGPALPREPPRFDYGTPDGYDFFLRLGGLAEGSARHLGPTHPYWQANLDHTSYTAFWRSRALTPHLSGITTAVLTVGGWFDAEDLAGPLAVYRQIERSTPGATNRLVMGPWAHGDWSRGDGDRLGNLSFAVKTAAEYRERLELPFFRHHLKEAPLADAPEAAMFLTGRNEWRHHEAWPPPAARPRILHFAAEGRLSDAAPTDAPDLAFDEYLSDPNRPVPYLAYPATGMRRDYMTEDQRFAATRPDVLVYATDPLAADVTVAGPIEVTLHVSTTGTDADWVVKVIDAYPGDYFVPSAQAPAQGQPLPANAARMGGYQQLVRGEPFRGKFRESFEKPVPFVPGQPAVIRFALPDVYHTFRRGHRLMVHVQSSWFPLVDRNPQTFMDIPRAKPGDFVRRTHRVYRGGSRASAVRFTTVP